MIAELFAFYPAFMHPLIMAGKKDHRPYQTKRLSRNRKLLVDAILSMGSTITNKGYHFVHAPWYHKSSKNGVVQRAKLIASIWNDKFLGKYDIVHHIDGDKGNDEPENLQIVDYCEHSAMELKNRWKIGHMNAVRKNGRWSLRHEKCIQCGTKERRHQSKGRCSLCENRRIRSSQ